MYSLILLFFRQFKKYGFKIPVVFGLMEMEILSGIKKYYFAFIDDADPIA